MSLFKQASGLGYSQAELFQLAQQQGLGAAELSKLSERFNQVKLSRAAEAQATPPVEGRFREAYYDSLKSLMARETDIFGLDFFSRNSAFLSFQPSFNVSTPKGYILGPGDELFIDIFGTSEQYYQAQISPDGNVLLENVGPVRLAGNTIEQARSKLINKLSSLYTGLQGSEPTTFLDLSLGQTRSIKVSIAGEVELPGTYNLSGFSTVLNSLYASGGIAENGTLRQIKLVRHGKLFTTVDLYRFLTEGRIENNVRLEDDDVVLVGSYTNRVSLKGAVKIPAKFEVKEGETLADLLRYAGGFREDAYTRKINLVRNQGGEKVIADVFEGQFEIFTVKAGDEYTVDQVLDRFTNRVMVKGAVYRPGDYSVTDGLTVKKLIERAEGLRADAFMERSFIVRTTEDLNTETISFDLRGIMNGSVSDIDLHREDVLTVLSINDLTGERYVEVSGEVNNPGVFPFAESMTIDDLVLMAQGFKESATGMRAEITRRISDEGARNNDLADVIVTDLALSFDNQNNTRLAPFDHVVIRRNPSYEVQQFVSVEGQVNYPGEYGIKDHGERISDLVSRAGGVNPFAYIEGATLIRRTVFFDDGTESGKHIEDLLKLEERLSKNPDSLTEAEKFLLSRVRTELALLSETQNNNQELSGFAKRERLQEILERNSFIGDVQLKQSEAIGIDLATIIENPGSPQDLLLQEGDILIVPRKTETVSLRGKLLYPTTVRYEKGRGLKHYINSAGGFDNRAKKGSTYVIYANGKVSRTKRFLFFKSFPKPAPGAEVIVPTKPLKVPVRIQEVVAVTSGLATLALVISQISNNNNN